MVAVARIPSHEGYIPFAIASVKKQCFTYFRIFGDLFCGRAPLICLHGTASGHSPLYGEMWPRYGVPVIVYDQIGCGRSTNLDADKPGDESFWQMELYIAELENLLDFFRLREPTGPGYHLFGVSLGGMIISDYATQRPSGLQRLVLASPVASYSLGVEGIRLRKGELSKNDQKILDEGIASKNYTTPAFRDAYKAYFRYCICRRDPFPKAFEPLLDNQIHRSYNTNTSLATILGLCPITTPETSGSMRDWNVIPRLHRITAATLLYNGEFDQSHDVCVKPFFDHIRRIRWHTFPGTSHTTPSESDEAKAAFFKLVGEFITAPSIMDAIE